MFFIRFYPERVFFFARYVYIWKHWKITIKITSESHCITL
jgi:hypothetical protein